MSLDMTYLYSAFEPEDDNWSNATTNGADDSTDHGYYDPLSPGSKYQPVRHNTPVSDSGDDMDESDNFYFGLAMAMPRGEVKLWSDDNDTNDEPGVIAASSKRSIPGTWQTTKTPTATTTTATPTTSRKLMYLWTMPNTWQTTNPATPTPRPPTSFGCSWLGVAACSGFKVVVVRVVIVVSATTVGVLHLL